MSDTFQLGGTLALAALLTIGCSVRQPLPNLSAAGQEEISQEDRAELMRLTLESEMLKKRGYDYNRNGKPGVFYLSTENVPSEITPRAEGITLIQLKPEEIKQLANSRGDFVYYFKFEEFKIDGPKVTVSLDHIPMYADKPAWPAGGGGVVVEYMKRDGEWVGKEVQRWIA